MIYEGLKTTRSRHVALRIRHGVTRCAVLCVYAYLLLGVRHMFAHFLPSCGLLVAFVLCNF